MENQKKVVRNIPIFIESRNEILINDETDQAQSQSFQPPPSQAHENDLKFTKSQAQSSSSSGNVCDLTKQPPVPESMPTASSHEHLNSQEQKHLESSIHAIQKIQVMS
jgi:hypothetical protein